MSNNNIVLEPPMSAIEKLMAKIAGVYDGELEPPMSAIEKLLYYIIENGGVSSWDGVLVDRTTGKKYKLFIDEGQVGVEEVADE